MQEAFATRLRADRERLGLSQQKCADSAGVSLSAWKGWEKDRSMPADKLELLWPLGFDSAYLLGGVRLEEEVEKRVRISSQEALKRVWDAIKELGVGPQIDVEALKTIVAYAFIARADKDEIKRLVKLNLEIADTPSISQVVKGTGNRVAGRDYVEGTTNKRKR